MSVHRYPGDFRIGVLNERRAGVVNTGVQQVPPKLMIQMLLSGWQKFVLAGQEFELDARQVPDALLFRMTAPAELHYRNNWGQPLVKLSLAMPPDWLDRLPGGCGDALSTLSGDFSAFRLIPAPEMVATARAIVATRSAIERMSLGMQLLNRCVAVLTGETPGGRPVETRDREATVIARLRGLICAAPEGQHLNAAELAQTCGIALRSLERLVKAQENISLGALIREERQQAGVQALRSGMSVGRASAIAGYSKAENFAAAIRKRYGCPPSALRRSVPNRG